VGGGAASSQSDWEIILEAVAAKCRFNVRSYQSSAVEEELPKLDFAKSVVVCDVGAGTHSILLNGRDGDWYLGFDPDWDQVKKKSTAEEEYVVFPEVDGATQGRVNVRIHKDHLFGKRATTKKRFSMGAVSQRNITIMSKDG
jgi:hypothetical protein